MQNVTNNAFIVIQFIFNTLRFVLLVQKSSAQPMPRGLYVCVIHKPLVMNVWWIL